MINSSLNLHPSDRIASSRAETRKRQQQAADDEHRADQDADQRDGGQHRDHDAAKDQ